jgi:hypothetical protein
LNQEEQEISKLVSVVRETLTPQLYVSLAANAALESNQSFDNKRSNSASSSSCNFSRN